MIRTSPVPAPGARLRLAGEFVRPGAVFADVGTDHGYLPISLLRSGAIRRAILTDVNEGPLAAAKENIRLAGLSDRAEFYLADGAACLEGRGVTDLAVCGMGGELIAAILSAAPFLRDGGVRLILQPMSRAAHLRRCLLEEGFAILDEGYAVEAGRAYVCLCAAFTGERQSPSAALCEFGRLLRDGAKTEAEKQYLRARLCALRRAADGKLRGGEDAEYELSLLEAAKAAFDPMLFFHPEE